MTTRHRRKHAQHVVPGYTTPQPPKPRPKPIRKLPEVDPKMTLEEILDILRKE